MKILESIAIIALLLTSFACQETSTGTSDSNEESVKSRTAKEILGNPDYLAISYGGYRQKSRDVQPTVAELKEDMKILSAMGVKLLRTYNTHLAQAANLLEAIHQLKQEDADFEMYVMLGAWINCENAWTDKPNHEAEDVEGNTAEIARAVKMANQYPDIAKIIAVGNEAMVNWAASYFVRPDVILKWVNHLQNLRKSGQLPEDTWITSSDNFAAWGGGDMSYHVPDLEALIRAVDFVSLHIYPMHETHYNPDFWGNVKEESSLSKQEKIEKAMLRTRDFGVSQYQNTADFIKSLGIEKDIHIGETGWASYSNGFYGNEGTKATDEYKEGLYYKLMRDWTAKQNMSCFYFEAFDEIWKDAANPEGSENHFGLFTLDGQAKYALWDLVDEGVFEDLGRAEKTIAKTYGGKVDSLLQAVMLPPVKAELD